jgi:hypothetical protein
MKVLDWFYRASKIWFHFIEAAFLTAALQYIFDTQKAADPLFWPLVGILAISMVFLAAPLALMIVIVPTELVKRISQWGLHSQGTSGTTSINPVWQKISIGIGVLLGIVIAVPFVLGLRWVFSHLATILSLLIDVIGHMHHDENRQGPIEPR